MSLTIRWRALGALLPKASPTWLMVGGVVLAGAIGCTASRTVGDSVRYAGTILQVLGLFTVAEGLRRMRRMFGRPTLRAGAKDWFRRLVAAFRQPAPIDLVVILESGAHMTGEVRVRQSAGPGASVDQRLEVLQENVNRLEEELDAKIRELRKRIADVQESLKRESEERTAGDGRTARQIEEVAVGGLHLEIVGLLWLTLGVLGTSIPDQIAALLSLIGW
jgi:hypothetical protein